MPMSTNIDTANSAEKSTDDTNTDEQKSLLNILEDMNKGKEQLEDQRVAMFNILEDVNIAQDALERKYKELDVIESLTQQLGLSLKLNTIMSRISDSILTLYPTVTVAYIIAPFDSYDFSKKVYVNSLNSVGNQYIRELSNGLALSLSTVPELVKLKNSAKQWIMNTPEFSFVKGQRDNSKTAIPKSMINVPLVVPDTLVGMVNISSVDQDFFTLEVKRMIYTLISTSVQTIDRIKKLISAEHSRLQSLIESMSNGVVMFDADENIVVANPKIRSVIQKNTGKLSLDDIFSYFEQNLTKNEVDENTFVSLSDAVEKAITTTETVHIKEFPLGRKYFEIFVTPVYGDQKETAGGAIILHDITELKEIDRMKSEFVSVASHQLRTPLTAINWYVEMLQAGDAGELNKEQKDFLDEIYNGSTRMVKLVNDLLNVSRIETGRLKIEPVPMQLETFIKNIIHELEVMAREHLSTVLFVKPEKSLPKIAIDETLMRQVVHNLITNAIRYSTAEASTITVMLSQKENTYVISVSDSGIGIPKEVQGRIFEKFYRADNAREKEAEGSGIGLYIAKMIVEESGGTLRFESPNAFRTIKGEKEGYGATFFLSLPTTGMKAHAGERSLSNK